ncbi:MAG: ParB/RepB/Spo0J family partition protein, partial [Deltaproteobacteria bacterium]|nr:ParB/RepB/Spo0J family partition protein [Deltaproteobacteria bacterium]
GERRLRAVRLLGWATVPVLVRHIADEHLLEAALVENLQREQLTPVEEALAYRALLDQYGYTQESLSQRVGKDRSTIANTVRLLALPQAVQQDLEEGRLSAGHARALLAVSDPARQIGIRNVILAKGLNVRETESLVNRQRPSATPSVKPSLPQREEVLFQSAQDTLERQLATRVIIRRAPGTQGEGAGKIEIEYYSLEDFNRLYERLNRS